MHFESSPETSKAIAILTATGAFIILYFFPFRRLGHYQFFLFLIGAAFVVVTIVGISARYSVSIDRETQLVIKEFSSKLVKRKWQYRITEFNALSIRSGGRGKFSSDLVVYCVCLKGNRTLNLTAWNSDKSKAESDAKEISDYLGLPVN